MRRSFCFLVGSVLWAFLAAISQAQYIGIDPSVLEFNVAGGGARAAGMGGAFLAIGDGEMAFSWNPGAMILADKAKIGIQLVSVNDTFLNSFTDISPLGDINTVSGESNRQHFSLNFGGFVAPFVFMDRDWAVGGGFRNVFDMVRESDVPSFYGTRDKFKQDRGVDAVSFGVANRLTEGVGFGLTVNSYIRNSEYNYYEGAAYLGISLDGRDTMIVDVLQNSNSHFSGFNVDVGAFGDFGMVRGGVVVHSPFKLRQDRKLTDSFLIPPEPFGFIDRVTYTYSMPFSYSLGVAVVPIESFTLAFDFDRRPLSDVEVKTNWEQLVFADSSFNPEWQDLNQFRVGAEYMFDGGFADIPVRVGFRNEPSVAKQIGRAHV